MKVKLQWNEGIWRHLFDCGIENRFDLADKDEDGIYSFQDFYEEFLKSRGRSSDSEGEEPEEINPFSDDEPPPAAVEPETDPLQDEGVTDKVQEKLLRDLGPLKPGEHKMKGQT